MDIKYIRDNEIHEKYILDQLDEKEKQAYEAFLKSHPEAQKELEETRKLISGIRKAGQSYMRKEIEEQVATLRNPKTDWSVLYKAAAVLFVLVLLPVVFYYQSQFGEQQKITEQTPYQESRVDDEDSAIDNNESLEAVPGENAEEAALKEIPAQRSVEREKSSAMPEKRSAAKGQQPAKTQPVHQSSAKSSADEITAKSEPARKEAVTAGTGSRQRIQQSAKAAPPDAIQNESTDIESDLDHVLGQVSKAGTLKKTTLSDKAVQSAPSGIIGMDYLPAVRSFTYFNDKDSLLLHLNRSSLREPFPDFLKVRISEDSLNSHIVNLYVSDPLHSIDRKDIKVTWQKDDKIDIIFTGKATYEIILNKDQKTARRIK